MKTVHNVVLVLSSFVFACSMDEFSLEIWGEVSDFEFHAQSNTDTETEFDTFWDTDTNTGPGYLVISEGDWISRGYGLGVRSMGEVIHVYQLAELSCILWIDSTDDDLEEIIEKTRSLEGDVLEIYPWNTAAPYTFDRVETLPEACADGGTLMIGDEGYFRSSFPFRDLCRDI